jgi:hypothetical protein
MKKSSIAQVATLFPLAIGLAMNGAGGGSRATSGRSQQPVNCSQFNIEATASDPLQKVSIPPTHRCTPGMSNGFPLPDAACTPGAINPTITAEVLQDPSFRTACVRGLATSEQQKAETYQWYGQAHPDNNSGANQTCELDHLVSLELGGADTLDNIWPQCGPSGAALSERYFKRKDSVENYLAKQVKERKMDLAEAQKGIATDWTQYLSSAEGCEGSACE